MEEGILHVHDERARRGQVERSEGDEEGRNYNYGVKNQKMAKWWNSNKC